MNNSNKMVPPQTVGHILGYVEIERTVLILWGHLPMR